MATIRETARNKSSFCVMPLLGIARDELYWDSFYLNCYIGIEEYDKLNNHFFIVFNFKGTQEYLTVKEKLTTHKHFKEEIVYTSKTNEYHVFVFTISIEDAKIIKLFKEGKYSKFSNTHKNLISKIHKVTQSKQLYHILHKTEKRRLELALKFNHHRLTDFEELWDIPYMNEEVLTLKNLK